MSKVVVHHNAAKYLKRLPEESRSRIKALLRGLEQSPRDQPGVKPMLGEWIGYHRVRAGKFRIVFWFDEKEDIVYVDHIGPRGDIYKLFNSDQMPKCQMPEAKRP
jgi:mRNA interferase RelE/StbE